jgi:hypothetical protein
MKEQSALREKEVAELRAEVAKLKLQIETLKFNVDVSSSSFSRSSQKGADSAALSEIRFPQDPTEENLRQYIREVLLASQGQNTFSTTDPQVFMLARVGSGNLNLLIDPLSENSYISGMGTYYLEYAINSLVEDRHQALVLEALPTKQRLVSTVMKMRWEQAARDILISELREDKGVSLSQEWIRAVASLKDPSTYDLLTESLANSRSPASVYNTIVLLPGIQLEAAVGKAWENTKTSPTGTAYTLVSMAKIAAAYGHQDAVECLINQLKNPPASPSSSANPRTALLGVLDVRGTNQEIISWYETNKENLVFDPEFKKFRLKS